MSNDGKNIVSQELDDRKIIVTQEGSVQVTERVSTVYKQQYRDFLSEVRHLEKVKEDIAHTLTEDFRNKQKEHLEKVEKEIKKLKPHLEEAEKCFLKAQEKARLQSVADRVKDELKKKPSEVNKQYMGAVWDNIRDNEKGVLDLLNAEEIALFKKYKLKSMQRR